MPTVGDIAKFIESIAPGQYAEDWDNTGLMIGNPCSVVKRVLFCLDVSASVTEEAVRRGVDLIISHHPLIFKKMLTIDESDYKGKIIHQLIKAGISVYSAHTNLDCARDGVNAVLASKIGLIDTTPYRSMDEKHQISKFDEIYQTDYFDTVPKIENNKVYIPSLGLEGRLKDNMGEIEFILHVKSVLGTNSIRTIGNAGSQISSVAVFSGSFDDDLAHLKKRCIDVLVTGDLKYHTALDAKEMGLFIIDAGHYYTEKPVLDKLKNQIEENFLDCTFMISEMEEDPFNYC